MKNFFNKKHKFFLKRHYKKALGVILGIIGLIIIVQVTPITFWLFILGFLLMILGWTIYRMV